jgi:hypothetical protein
MSSTTPSATRKSASLASDQAENGRSWSWGRLSASFLICWRWASVNVARPTAAVARVQRVEPVGVEVVDHLADTVLAGEGDLGDRGAGMPWAASRIIWARCNDSVRGAQPTRWVTSTAGP